MDLTDLLIVGTVIMIAFWCWILFEILTADEEGGG
jgi:hypothetical protein